MTGEKQQTESGEKRGYGRYYQRTAEIESSGSDLMRLEKRYDRETEFALVAAGIGAEDRTKEILILDLASGTGSHAKKFAEKLPNSRVEAREIEEAAIEAGNLKLNTECESIRQRVHLAHGNMGEIKNSVEDDARYDLITIMGSSFMYLGSRENHEKALRDYYDLLKPGGKLIMQFRERKTQTDENELQKYHQRYKVRMSLKEAEGAEGNFGKLVPKGTLVDYYEDLENGDSFYVYMGQVESTEKLTYKEADPNNGIRKGLYDQDGVRLFAFGRVYCDKDGNEHDLGVAQIRDYMELNGYNRGLKPMLEQTGFQNVRIQGEPLSPEGSRWQYAVVAEKPF